MTRPVIIIVLVVVAVLAVIYWAGSKSVTSTSESSNINSVPTTTPGTLIRGPELQGTTSEPSVQDGKR